MSDKVESGMQVPDSLKEALARPPISLFHKTTYEVTQKDIDTKKRYETSIPDIWFKENWDVIFTVELGGWETETYESDPVKISTLNPDEFTCEEVGRFDEKPGMRPTFPMMTFSFGLPKDKPKYDYFINKVSYRGREVEDRKWEKTLYISGECEIIITPPSLD